MSRKIIITESERKSILEKYTTLGHQETEITDFVVGNYYMSCWFLDDEDLDPIFSIIKVTEVDGNLNSNFRTFKYQEIEFSQYNELLNEQPIKEDSTHIDTYKGKYWQSNENEWNAILNYPYIDNNERVDGCKVCLSADDLKVGEYYQSAENGDHWVMYVTRIENDKIYTKEFEFSERIRFSNENEEWSWDKSDLDKSFDPSSKQFWEKGLSLPKINELRKYKTSKRDNETEEEKKQESKDASIEKNKEEVSQETNDQTGYKTKVNDTFKSEDGGKLILLLKIDTENKKYFFLQSELTAKKQYSETAYEPLIEEFDNNSTEVTWLKIEKNEYDKSLENIKNIARQQPKEDNLPEYTSFDFNVFALEKNQDYTMKNWTFIVGSNYTSSARTENESYKLANESSQDNLRSYFKEKLGENTKINFNVLNVESKNVKEDVDSNGNKIYVTYISLKIFVTDVVGNGEFLCQGDCENGNGTLKYPNGNIASGTFENSKLVGNSKFIDKKRNFTIYGNFVNGYVDGKGAVKFTDGTIYRGVMKTDEEFKKISVVTPEGQTISDVIEDHRQKQYKPNNNVTENPSYDFGGQVYYLNELQTKFPFIGAKVTAVKYKDNKPLGAEFSVYTDQSGNFKMRLERGDYEIKANSNNQFFESNSLGIVKVLNNMSRNIKLEKTRRGAKVSDDFIYIGVQTIFNNPVKLENKIHKKSNSKFEYCVRFTNYYYKIVTKKGGELKKINQNNLINSKNFITNCYKEYLSQYDEDITSKIKKLSNLDGNIEVFEL